MSGEARGDLAEAITKTALSLAVRNGPIKGQIFWEESPDNISIKPDLTLGPNKNSPTHLLLINASDSPKNSDMKFWRNVCEVFDSKALLSPRPVVLNIVFKSEVKPELLRMTNALCDVSIIVDKIVSHGTVLDRRLTQHASTAPTQKENKASLVESAITRGSVDYDANFARAVNALVSALTQLLQSKERRALIPLWQLISGDASSRTELTPRLARTTMLRRGLARWIVLEPEFRAILARAHLRGKSVPMQQVPEYAKTLGMVTVSIGGAVLVPGTVERQNIVNSVASDLVDAMKFYRAAAHDDVERALNALEADLAAAPQEMVQMGLALRLQGGRIAEWHAFVQKNWKTVCTPPGCYTLLRSCAADPTMRGKFDAAAGRNWLYDHLIAILRVRNRAHNDCGYGRLVSKFRADRNTPAFRRFMTAIVQSADDRGQSKRWVAKTLPTAAEPGRRGFQDWLEGRKLVADAIVAAFAYSISSFLTELSSCESIDNNALSQAHAYNLWNKLLTYQDFEPVAGVVAAAAGKRTKRVRLRSLLAEIADADIKYAGEISVLRGNRSIVYWKSAHGSHTYDKRKELSARARAIRFAFDGSTFRVREGIDKLILVLDGTFDADDIRVLQIAGWDRIFYPDEVEALVGAIG